MEESLEFWQYFGISRPNASTAGRDYSWIELQHNMDFIGCDDTIIGCTVFYASRKRDTLLLRTPDRQTYFWNISQCAFSILGSILVVACGPKIFHLSGVTSTFIDYLMKSMKLQLDSLSEAGVVEPMPIEVIDTDRTENSVVSNASNILEPQHRSPVIVTGAGISEELRGTLKITSDAVVLDTSDDWKLMLNEIVSVTKTHVGKFFVVVEMIGESRYEIAFEDADASDGLLLYNLLTNEVTKRSS